MWLERPLLEGQAGEVGRGRITQASGTSRSSHLPVRPVDDFGSESHAVCVSERSDRRGVV